MTKRKINSIINEKRLFLGLLGLFVGLVGLYMYLVSATVMHVVLQTELKQEAKHVTSEISMLENKLILAQHKVSADIASMQGFTAVSKKVYIDRTPDSLVLSGANRAQ